MRAHQHVAGRGRGAGPDREIGDRNLAPGERVVDGREVRDQQREQRQPHRRLAERRERGRQVGRAFEAEGEE